MASQSRDSTTSSNTTIIAIFNDHERIFLCTITATIHKLMVIITYYGLNSSVHLLVRKGKSAIFLMDCQIRQIPDILSSLQMTVALLLGFSIG